MLRKRRRILWGALLASALLCFAAIPILLMLTQPPATRREDNCRQDDVLPAHTIVLLDQSDPYSESDIKWVSQLIVSEAKALDKYGRLTVVSINELNEDEPVEVFSRCSPGSPQQANLFWENRRLIADDWDKKFSLQLRQDVADLLTRRHSNYSPLAEHVRGIVRRVDFQRAIKKRELLILSDLEQNSREFSFVRSDSDLGETFGSYLQGMDFPDMSGVRVLVFQADRRRPERDRLFREVWDKVLTQYNATITDVRQRE